MSHCTDTQQRVGVHTSWQSTRYVPDFPSSSGDVAANMDVAAPCSHNRQMSEWHRRRGVEVYFEGCL